jgi:hypothetical protein
MRTFRDELASRLVAAGHNQKTLTQAGFGADDARRLLGLDGREMGIDLVGRAAAMIGCSLGLIADSRAVAAEAVSEATRGKRAPTFVPDELAEGNAMPLIRKRKTTTIRLATPANKPAVVKKAATVRRQREEI